MTYREKLQDPRWQRIRLRVFERDGFKCVACGNEDRTLNVHHMVYHRNPWESPLDELATMCSECHENLEVAIKLLRENPTIRALPHIVNRAVILDESNPMLPFKLLGNALRLCGESSSDNALTALTP